MAKGTAVIYHYYEKDEIYQENLVYFLASGIHRDADYVIIVSGECSVSLPVLDNVTYVSAPNWNNDFGGYIKYVRDYFSDAYEHYIFVNSSVRGPFTPAYLTGFWGDIFTSRLRDDVHLVGSTINILPETSEIADAYKARFPSDCSFAHVQSTSYALTRTALKHLIATGFYNVNTDLDKLEVIVSYELRLSLEIMKRGWQIASILPIYEGFDCRHGSLPWENMSAKNGDVLWKLAFYGRSVSPLEAVFIKTNRDMIEATELASFTFTGLCRRTALTSKFDAAGRLRDACYRTLGEVDEQRRKVASRKQNIQQMKRNLKNFVLRSDS